MKARPAEFLKDVAHIFDVDRLNWIRVQRFGAAMIAFALGVFVARGLENGRRLAEIEVASLPAHVWAVIVILLFIDANVRDMRIRLFKHLTDFDRPSEE